MAGEQDSPAAAGTAETTNTTADATSTVDPNLKPEGTPLASDASTTAPEAKDGEKTDKAAAGAPETYADFIYPEGLEKDAALETKFREWAKGKNLSQEDAQSALNLGMENIKAISQAQETAFKTVTEGWLKEAQADAEIGGSKDAFDANVAVGMKAIEKFGNEKFEAMLDDTGVGNHPEMIRFFKKVGEQLTEGTIHPANKGVEAQKSLADRIFTSQAKS
jgi:hypothetical protein